MAIVKHSAGVAGAITGIGESEFLPNMLINRSPCSVFVGIPVDGPARCTSTTTSGSSTITARPSISAFSAIPGPEVVVMPIAPPYAAPTAAPIAAISSSDCTVLIPRCLYPES